MTNPVLGIEEVGNGQSFEPHSGSLLESTGELEGLVPLAYIGNLFNPDDQLLGSDSVGSVKKCRISKISLFLLCILSIWNWF